MLRWLFQNQGFSPAEFAAVEQLAAAHRRMTGGGAAVDTGTDEGHEACSAFLKSIDDVCQTFGVKPVARDYREHFSANYKALFPDQQRHLRVDILEASIDQQAELWVNGELYDLSEDARVLGAALQEAWTDLGVLLIKWATAPAAQEASAGANSGRPDRAELAEALSALDDIWARFECKYIMELIAIESKARQPVADAAAVAAKLRAAQKQGDAAEGLCRGLETELIGRVSRLNTVANAKRKGRDDLGPEIIHRAQEVMRLCEAKYGRGALRGAASDAAKSLAADVLDAFEAVVDYLLQASQHIERVDPHLCNNEGLAARLADWEESWEVGLKYLLKVSTFEAILDLTAVIKDLSSLSGEIVQMCEDCDVELFLVLPRVVLLCFLHDPANRRGEIVRQLLPHLFGEAPASGGDVPQQLRETWSSFGAVLKDVERSLQPSHPGAGAAASAAWELVVCRAVRGNADAGEGYDRLPLPAKKAMEVLMREVEGWSLQLQRHCPEDWNQFSSVLVQCLLGGKGRQRESPEPFRV